MAVPLQITVTDMTPSAALESRIRALKINKHRFKTI